MGIVGKEGGFLYDTTKPGNSNHGHELAIIEHLKIRNDDVDGPPEPMVPSGSDCTALVAAGTAAGASRR